MHPGSFSAISESSTGCSPLRMGLDSQECCATLYVLSIRSRYDAFIAAGGSNVRFLKNLIQVN